MGAGATVNVSVIIATYGEQHWNVLAHERALPSTVDQGAHEVIVHHDLNGTIASARNWGAGRATGNWLCFLDADDELAPGYIEAMTAAESRAPIVGPALLTPAVSYVGSGRPARPKFWPEKSLSEGNWLVIGTLVPRLLFVSIGGFRDWPHAFEDWDLFARCWKAGAAIVKVPDAVYVAHVRGGSRNRTMSRREQVELHYEIGRDLFPDLYDEAWLERHLRNVPKVRHGRPRGRTGTRHGN
jgi:glycosyltransferase involved in cell wall biosynthesis